MANLPSNLTKEAGAQLYQALLDAVQQQIEQQAPQAFTFRWQPTNTNEQAVSDLIVQPVGADGYCQIFPVFNHLTGENWRLIILETLQEYNALFFKAQPADNPTDPWQHFEQNFLEGVVSPDPRIIADRVIEWAFPPPRQAVLPFSPEERLALERIAHGRRLRFTDADRLRSQQLRRAGQLEAASQAVGLHWAIDRQEAAARLSPASLAALEADLRHLLPDRLIWHFPSQRDGRWALQQRVILAIYDSQEPLSRFRKLALVAISPMRRREQQVIQLQLEAVIPENHLHHWEAARWFWDERAQNATRGERWGIEGLPLDLLQQDRLETLAYLQQRHQAGACTSGERAALAILLQDEGRLDEALALFAVTIGPQLWKVIGSEKVYFHYCHYPKTSTWPEATQRILWQCAPWRLAPGLQAAKAGSEPWAAADRGKQAKLPTFRLHALRGQRDSRKVALQLAATDRTLTQAEFELAQTGSNRRLPLVCWQRPLEIDFLRFHLPQGLLSDA